MRPIFRTIVVASLAAFALSAVVASAAQAEEAPFFKVAGTRLAEGQSHETTSTGTIQMKTEWVDVRCKVKMASGAKILGSNAGNPGGGELSLEFSECVAVGGRCTLPGVTKSEPLHGELVTLGGEKERDKGQFGLVLSPSKGRKFMLLKFGNISSELHCPQTETTMNGEIVAELRGKGKLPGEIGEHDEVGKELAEAKGFQLNFPSSTIQHYWGVNHGIASYYTIEPLATILDEVVWEGYTSQELASEPVWGVYL